MQLAVPCWWSFVALVAVALALAGCAPAAPAAVSMVIVDDARFRVEATRSHAVARRQNPDLRLRRGAMVARGAVAIERATGCALRPGTLRGDVAVVTAALNCPGVPPGAARAGPAGLHCQTLASRPVAGGGYDVETLECTAWR